MASFDGDDLPASDPDFAFDTLADRLVRALQRDRSAAFVLGLHGPWGSGKTSLLLAVRKRLPANAIIVDFNAWKYHDKEALWRALILRMLDALEKRGSDAEKISELKRSLYEPFSVKERGSLKVNWSAAVTETLLAVVSVASFGIGGSLLKSLADGIGKVFSSGSEKEKSKDVADRVERIAKVFERQTTERAVQQVVSIEQFLDKFRDITAALGKDQRIYAMIDDLDRCLPDSALEIFEAIKLFLDAPQCSYIIAVDRAVIQRGLELRYPRNAKDDSPPVVDADEYIEKTITLSFDLPTLADADGRKLMQAAGMPTALTSQQIGSVITVLGTNPRRLKRFSVMLAFWFDVATSLPKAAQDKLAFSPLKTENVDLFLKLALIGYLNSGVITQMLRDPALPGRLQSAFDAARGKATPFLGQQELAERVDRELPVVRDAIFEPALLRAMALSPSFVAEPKLRNALSWFRSATV